MDPDPFDLRDLPTLDLRSDDSPPSSDVSDEYWSWRCRSFVRLLRRLDLRRFEDDSVDGREGS